MAKPGYILGFSEQELDERVKWDEDICVIAPKKEDPDGTTHYFIRTVLKIPILETEENFGWGVWVSQSKESFERYVDTFGTDQSNDGSFGYLPVDNPHYSRTEENEYEENLECDIIWGEQGQRPTVEIRECDHPWFLDQSNGITMKKAISISTQYCNN
jgi:hypothetical protein